MWLILHEVCARREWLLFKKMSLFYVRELSGWSRPPWVNVVCVCARVCMCVYERVYMRASVQFSRSVVSDSLQPHELQHARPPCPSPTPRVICVLMWMCVSVCKCLCVLYVCIWIVARVWKYKCVPGGMCVCIEYISVCMWIFVFVNLNACECLGVCECVCVCMWIFVYPYKCVCLPGCMYVQPCECVCLGVFACI